MPENQNSGASGRRLRSAQDRRISASCRAFKKLLANVVKAFNNAPQEKFADVMNESLGSIALFLKLDRSAILLFGRDQNHLQVAYGWAGKGIPPVPIGRNIENDLPWFAGHVRTGHLLLLSEPFDNLPREAVKERRFLSEESIKSHLVIPLIADGVSIGAATFASMHLGHHWEPDIILCFRLFGEILTLALEKYRSSVARGLPAEHVLVPERKSLAFRIDSRHLRQLVLHLMKAEHRERRRLVESLHEDVMQTLAVAGFMLDSMERSAESGNSEDLLKVNTLIHSALGDLRTLVMNLQPLSLHECNLDTALHLLARQVERVHGTEVRVDVGSEPPPIDEDIRILLYEAAKELLSNAAVHGGATKAAVELQTVSSDYQMTVSDNGCGFDTALVEEIPSKCFGLFALREKARLLGGSLEITCAPGAGTRVTITLPMASIGPATS